MSEALAAIEARLATLRNERAMLEYCDSFEEWGRRSRQIDAEVATLEGQAVSEVFLEKDQSRAEIDVVVMEAFRKVSMAPRCARSREAARRA